MSQNGTDHSEQNPLNRKKKYNEAVISLGLIIASLLFVFLVCETLFRVRSMLYPLQLSDVIVQDAGLGWKARPNYSFTGKEKDFSGIEFDLEIVTDAEGFREFGTGPGPCKVLFLGDSFTFAKDVSQEHTYYRFAAEKAPITLYAHGTDGHGTLQEYLALQEWLEKLQPRVVVLQLCYNDFIDNHLELNKNSVQSQCHVPQPFLLPDNTIHYLNPGDGRITQTVGWFPSELLRSLAYRIDNRHGFPDREKASETLIENGDPAATVLFEESKKITSLIMKRIRKACGSIPILAFDVSTKEPYFSAFKEICAENDIQFLDEIARTLQERSASGNNIFASDGGHWNRLGHQICGEILVEYLKDLCIDK
ncbi:MAG: SGNH/GDSL hydrolase family protein [Candidatus Hydrogenedens sp.]|jgi:lysophospholipase L1-like esterase|nr:SGNH/GDSL hydrolase family protein [Candidatus Hydrogenedens sp.]